MIFIVINSYLQRGSERKYVYANEECDLRLRCSHRFRESMNNILPFHVTTAEHYDIKRGLQSITHIYTWKKVKHPLIFLKRLQYKTLL